jgi:hypothetical protein
LNASHLSRRDGEQLDALRRAAFEKEPTPNSNDGNGSMLDHSIIRARVRADALLGEHRFPSVWHQSTGSIRRLNEQNEDDYYATMARRMIPLPINGAGCVRAQGYQVGPITLASVMSLFIPSFLSPFLTVPGRFNHARFCHARHYRFNHARFCHARHYVPCLCYQTFTIHFFFRSSPHLIRCSGSS